MAYSRASIPLFTLFLLAITTYMIYIIVVKNIFNVSIEHNSASNQHPFEMVIESKPPGLKTKIPVFDLQVQKLPIPSTKKQTDAQVEDAGNSLSYMATQAKNTAQESLKGDSINSTTVAITTQSPQQAHAYEHKLLWDKYSVRVPRLYSRPISADTAIILSRVGEISMSLDLLYLQDRGAWMLHVEEARAELLAIAIKGEREGARALGFQYFRAPFNRTTDSLSWAMIANAIAANDYYLTICVNRPESCSEDAFALASEQAKSEVVNNGFVLRK
jgi:hypothetical protein